MHRSNLVVCAAIACFSIAAASGKELEGQVFVVTRGAQAIKLPLVQVMALPVDEVQKHISEVTEKTNLECTDAESKTKKAIEALQNARRGVSGGFGRWMMTLQKTQSKDPTGKAWADPRTEALRYNALENDTVENYFWFVRVKQTDASITLSNDNLTSAGSSDSILATKN